MKHSGKATQAAVKMLGWTFVLLFIILAMGLVAKFLGSLIIAVSTALVLLWMLFAIFTLYFFRDPQARVPSGANLVVSPGHGKVDMIDELDEPVFMGGRCKRISMFLSVIDVHVQNTPVAGTVKYVRHTSGKFLNAMAAESAAENENVLIGFESSERPGVKIGARLIAGLIARRIIPYSKVGEHATQGDRFGLIRFGSRVDVFVPPDARAVVAVGDRTAAGTTVIARFGDG